MTIWNSSGTTAGTGVALVADGNVLRYAITNPSTGVAINSALGGILSINSGYAFGYASLLDPFLVTGSGTTFGVGTVATATPLKYVYGQGFIHGQGDTYQAGVPLPCIGSCTITGYSEVISHKRICPCPPPCKPRLTYGQTLGPNDLSICFSRGDSYVAPYSINYTLFQRNGSYLLPIGPSNQSPLQSSENRFYIVGILGEGGGQPGYGKNEWVIRWSWQTSFGSPYETFDQPFDVLGYAETQSGTLPGCAPLPGKYGWGDEDSSLCDLARPPPPKPNCGCS